MLHAPRLLPEIFKNLLVQHGLNTAEAAVRSGISPGTVVAHSTRIANPVLTWLRCLAAFHVDVVIEAQGQRWRVAMPKPATPLIERAWAQWRHRRQHSAVHHSLASGATLAAGVLQQNAQRYSDNEEVRLRQRLTEMVQAAQNLGGTLKAAGLREALRQLAGKLGTKAEELALLTGISLGAAQMALADHGDGRLLGLHRLASALNARLHIYAGSGRIEVGLCAPGPWRPGMVEVEEASENSDEVEMPKVKAVKAKTGGTGPHRSVLDQATILSLYDQGESIGHIARQAGVSRQRIHRIAQDAGRPLRRERRQNALVDERLS